MPITFDYFDAALSAYYILAPTEASANLERYDGVRYGHRAADVKNLKEMIVKTFKGFGDEVKRRIIMGTFVLSSGYYDAYYLQGQQVRSKVIDAFKAVFADVDVMALPTSPSPAFGLQEIQKTLWPCICLILPPFRKFSGPPRSFSASRVL